MSTLDKIVAAIAPPESAEERAEAHATARRASAPGDWLSLLLDHHEKVEAAFRVAREAPPAEAKAALKRLGAVLNGHSMAEEAVVYPELARLGKEAHADMAYLQQVAAKMQLAALERLDPASREYADKLGHLEGAVVHHVYKEESEWFLDLKENVSAADEQRILQRYGEEFERYMRGGEGPAAGAKPDEGRGFEPKSFQPRPAT